MVILKLVNGGFGYEIVTVFIRLHTMLVLKKASNIKGYKALKHIGLLLSCL